MFNLFKKGSMEPVGHPVLVQPATGEDKIRRMRARKQRIEQALEGNPSNAAELRKSLMKCRIALDEELE